MTSHLTDVGRIKAYGSTGKHFLMFLYQSLCRSHNKQMPWRNVLLFQIHPLNGFCVLCDRSSSLKFRICHFDVYLLSRVSIRNKHYLI